MGHILVHIALENRIEGSQKSLEAISVDSGNLDFGLGDDVGGTRFAQKEGTLTEVVGGTVGFDLGGGGSVKRLGGDSFTTDNDVEVATVSTLSKDLGTSGESGLLDGIGDLAALVMVDRLEDRDGREEIFVSITLVLSGILHDVSESVTVELPKRNCGFGNNSGGTGSVVKKSELTEGITRLVCL